MALFQKGALGFRKVKKDKSKFSIKFQLQILSGRDNSTGLDSTQGKRIQYSTDFACSLHSYSPVSGEKGRRGDPR